MPQSLSYPLTYLEQRGINALADFLSGLGA